MTDKIIITDWDCVDKEDFYCLKNGLVNKDIGKDFAVWQKMVACIMPT